jgi:transposase InsO family protein
MMIVHQLTVLHQQVGWPYRTLCQAVPVAYSTFMCWKGQLQRGEPLIRKPGPKPIGSLDLERLQAQLRRLAHGHQRTAGTGALYRLYRHEVSRRQFQGLVKTSRRQMWREHEDQLRRIRWNVPGAVWSLDPTKLSVPRVGREQKLQLLTVQDLGSRYKFPPLVGARTAGEIVAEQLEKLFHQYGPPLVLKRDNGSNLNHEAVNEVLARYLVIPLNSPVHYPPYNGGIERAQRELKEALLVRPLAASDHAILYDAYLSPTVHELNHQPRRCLRRRTPCELFAGAKQALRVYTRRRRKEAYDWISELAMAILMTSPVHKQQQADAAWRLAVETWLQKQGIITISQPKSVTRFP